ncbi:Conserved_hypothetical protein [Hexamita inflata]|uniref:Uncharacterized protein n=1 Tax=Hexamita inflata TaxID=28002 RepID=A0AA86VBJ1_9EUKA|nr:Conserved hypothetical protein [Hexamita inflata]
MKSFSQGQTWSESMRTYRQVEQPEPVNCRPPTYRSPPQIMNPITHQFYDKKNEQIYNDNKVKYETQILNAARDKQMRQNSTFDFVTQSDHYHKISPPPIKAKLANYDFQQPHVKPPNYIQHVPVQRNHNQRKSDNLASTFTNTVIKNQPLFGGKNRDFAHTGGKKIHEEPNNFELGYDERQVGTKNIQKTSSKKMFNTYKKTELGYFD